MKKLNLVCKLVRKAHVDAALLQLSLQPRKPARFVRKLIHEAKFNAAVQGMDPERLLVDEVRIGRASYLKRLEIKARGKTGVRRKPYCNIFVYVREIQPTDEFVQHSLKRKRPRWKRDIAEMKAGLRAQYAAQSRERRQALGGVSAEEPHCSHGEGPSFVSLLHFKDPSARRARSGADRARRLPQRAPRWAGVGWRRGRRAAGPCLSLLSHYLVRTRSSTVQLHTGAGAG
eukprot:CAMPEP_0114147096 /NCGR_PEP_ID=MMETSP0043_2-20121206/20910_1 /TAXON_ID=464988 /ORGANISM="Hemiselmis andersenii, Strain CCMP644" /LENGTH=229 /DNA_ID=CAMNT_0001241583 /DNA_START=59 /DNA_END=745 /DNA_ORIENTATION=+